MSRLVSLAVLLTAGVAATAFAAPQSAPAPDQPATTAASTATSSGHRSPLKPGDRNCIRDTGSLIPPKKGECLPVSGRSYNQQDLDNTGERTLGPALEKLDPSITVRGSGY